MLALFTFGLSPCPRLMDKPELVLPFTFQVGLAALLVLAWRGVVLGWRNGYLGGCLPTKANKLDLYPYPFIG